MANDLMFLNIMDEEGNWVGIPGLKGDTGEPAPVVSIKGNYATAAALQAAIPNPEPGFAGFVGAESPYDLYIYTEDNGWFNYGPVSGGSVDVDDSLSLVSQNPVQNAVITDKVGIDELDTSAQDLSAAINELYGLATTPKYGVCTTAAGTPEKAVSINGITALTTGLTIAVKFSAANTAANPTLNVNGLSPKPIYQYGTTPAAETAETSGWQAGAVVLLTYDGTGWEMNKGFNAVPTNHASTSDTYGKATSTNYGHVKISDDLTDTTPAATGGVVPSMKAVSDLNESINTDVWTLASSYAATIPNGTDYDTLTTPGTFKVTSGTNAATMINPPTTSAGHRLIVCEVARDLRIVQIALINSESDPIKYRSYNGSVWSEWYSDGTLRNSLNSIESSIAIVADGNTHTAIASGQYIYIKNHDTLTDGLYRATAAIPLNDPLNTTNVSAVSNGGFNDLIRYGVITPVRNETNVSASNYSILCRTYGDLVFIKGSLRLDKNVTTNSVLVSGLPIPLIQPEALAYVLDDYASQPDSSVYGKPFRINVNSSGQLVPWYNPAALTYLQRAGIFLSINIVYPMLH